MKCPTSAGPPVSRLVCICISETLFGIKGGHHLILCQAAPYSLCLTISLSLMSLTLSLSSFGRFKALFRCFFFEFSLLFGLFNNFPGLVFRELRVLPPKTLSMATTAVTFPVSEFSIAISLALIVSSASLVALVGRESVDLIRLSTSYPCYWTQYPIYRRSHYPAIHEHVSYCAS